MKDYYNILGIPLSADATEIKKAYRQLALKYHPDKNKAPDAAARFIEIHEAYEILYNQQKRAYYDSVFIRGKSAVNLEDKEFKNWAEEAHRKGEEYAGMEYEFFIARVYNTFQEAHETTRLWVIMLAALAVSITSTVLLILSIYRIVIGENEFENSIIISWLLLSAFTIVGLRGSIIIAKQLFKNFNTVKAIVRK